MDLNVNIAKFTPSISVFLNKLSKGTKEDEIQEFSVFDFKKEIGKIEQALESEKSNDDQYTIVKDLIKYISK